jgi:molybdopterin molybdotransferase
MAQLSDDCFAFGGELMRAADALAILAERAPRLVEAEMVPLDAGLGRVLATAVTAIRAVPPHDNVAVDGYAVRAADLAGDRPSRMAVVGPVAAGDWPTAPAVGVAVRVFTGAPLPPGCDTVFMQEDVRVEGGEVVLPPGLKPGANRRRAGEDVATGAEALAAGVRLRPQELALLASLGATTVNVWRRLVVAVMSTGDELREPGAETPPGTVFDANRAMLRAALGEAGCRVIDLGIVADRPEAVAAALARGAAESDLVISSGGVSTGDADHVRAAVAAAGAIHFWRLAIRPGRPLAFGTVHGKAFVGLPGNPVAAYVCFLRFTRPILARLGGAAPTPWRAFPVTSGFAQRKKPGRREWLRCRLIDGPNGPVADRFPRDGAGIVSSLVFADGLVEVAEDVERIAEGDRLDFLPFPG